MHALLDREKGVVVDGVREPVFFLLFGLFCCWVA